MVSIHSSCCFDFCKYFNQTVLLVGNWLGKVVRWLTAGCRKSEKVNKTSINELFKKPIQADTIDLRGRVKIDLGPIQSGYGEIVIFDSSKEISKEIYEKAYQVIHQYEPSQLALDKTAGEERYEKRLHIIRNALKSIDPNLEAVFVPRTLYELLFVRACIEEDLQAEEICPFVNPFHHKEKNLQKCPLAEKCWHRCHFEDAGDNNHPELKNVAYRLNQLAVTTFSPTSTGFTFDELSKLTENEIAFLEKHHQWGEACFRKELAGEKVEIVNCNIAGPLMNFAFESTRGSIRPMGIRDRNDAQIIRNAIALECSEVAKRSIFLYRGANHEKDEPVNKKGGVYSCSYGTGLFAGLIFDGSATAFHFMRQPGKNATAIPIPIGKLFESPFYYPHTSANAQFFGELEIFHGRSKFWKDAPKVINGFDMTPSTTTHLQTDIPKEEFIKLFQEYKSKTIHLK